jgi:sulfur-oxidizing protein SoxY
LVFAALPAMAEPGADDPSRIQRWNDLRHAILDDRPVTDARGAVTLEAPERALDAALVPITVRLAGGPYKTLYLVIDDNPSPLVGTFRFGPAADTRELRTRVRVDDYTLIHAVAETNDGRLLVAQRFVKASGGCSAPASGSAEEALARLGRMKLKPASDGPAGAQQVQLLVSHPNYNGMQMDQVTRLYTPARFVQDIRVTEGDRLVFDLASDISLSEDPSITFGLKSPAAGPLKVDVTDSANARFAKSFDIPSVTN